MTCLCFGCVLVLSWLCLRCVFGVPWLWLDCVLVVCWLCLACVLAVPWLCLGCVLAVSWLCLGCVLAVSWLCLVGSFRVSSGRRTKLNWTRAGFIQSASLATRRGRNIRSSDHHGLHGSPFARLPRVAVGCALLQSSRLVRPHAHPVVGRCVASRPVLWSGFKRCSRTQGARCVVWHWRGTTTQRFYGDETEVDVGSYHHHPVHIGAILMDVKVGRPMQISRLGGPRSELAG